MNKKTFLKIFLRSTIAILLLIFLLSRINYKNIVIIRFFPVYLLWLIISILLTYLFRTNFLKRTLFVKKVKKSELFLTTSVYNFISSILPFGLGHFSYPYLLSKYYKVNVPEGMSSLILYNMFRIVMLIALLIYVVFKKGVDINFYLTQKTILIIVGVLGAIFFIAISRYSNFCLVKKIYDLINKMLLSIKKVLQPAQIIYLLIFTILIIIVNMFTLYSSYKFFGYNFDFIVLVLLLSIINLSNLLPIHSIGKLGSYEAINTIVLIYAGLGKNEAIQLSFGVHFINLLLQAIIAFPCYILMKKAKVLKKK